eukprot:COSAG06_NODE_4_length_41837_cov_204.557597_26_plen_158_part_00
MLSWSSAAPGTVHQKHTQASAYPLKQPLGVADELPGAPARLYPAPDFSPRRCCHAMLKLRVRMPKRSLLSTAGRGIRTPVDVQSHSPTEGPAEAKAHFLKIICVPGYTPAFSFGGLHLWWAVIPCELASVGAGDVVEAAEPMLRGQRRWLSASGWLP